MNKPSILSALGVIVFYIIGLIMKINMALPLFIIFILSGLFVYFDPGEKGIRVVNYRNNSFLDAETHNVETKNNAYKSSPMSSILVSIVITDILCYIHFIVFMK